MRRLASPAPVLLLVALLAAGCASGPAPDPRAVQPPAPVESRTPAGAGAAAPVPVRPAPPPPPQSLLQRLLPPTLKSDRGGWSSDILAAFSALRLAPSAENLCASIAVIEQESGFQADPVVPGLSRMVRAEIEARRQRFHVPPMVVEAALARRSADGRSFGARIDALRTERQLSELYEEIIAAVPAGRLLLSDYNPVRTGGPMQVSIAYAELHARQTPYRGPGRTIREAVFTRRGGVHFGIAHLLDYPAPYRAPIHRFADFNAGHYAARNAAFQQAVTRLSGHALVPDGDLLRYRNGVPDAAPGATQRALHALAPRLRLAPARIDAELRQEKEAGFARTAVYQRVYALADAAAGRRVAREAMPQITLKSPKIQRKLTTAWFADRVNRRYHGCLRRAR